MHEGKWIDELTPSMPVAEAARLVLDARLGVVAKCLPPALSQAREDVEHIHQLRVSTRRARAALDIFVSCLAETAYEEGRKQLRRIRRAAGAARDWDVFLASLAESKPRWASRQIPTRDLLAGYALSQRGIGQQKLDNLGADFPEGFDKVRTQVLAGISIRRARQSLLDLAKPLLAGLLQEIDQGLAGDLDNYAKLHQVRIDGKRLRYALEVFAGCFPRALRTRWYPVVEEMQEVLGDANDSHVALGHLDNVAALLDFVPSRNAARFRSGLRMLKKHHEGRLENQRRLFEDWQNRWRDLDELKATLGAPPDGMVAACAT